MPNTKFTNLIHNYRVNLNEQGEGAPPGEVAPPADPAAEMPPEPAPAVAPPPAPIENQAVEDISIAKSLALQLSDISTADRGVLIQQVTGDNIDVIREVLNGIAALYEVPGGA